MTNADLVPLGRDDVPDLRIDLTDAGQVFNAIGLAWFRLTMIRTGLRLVWAPAAGRSPALT